MYRKCVIVRPSCLILKNFLLTVFKGSSYVTLRNGTFPVRAWQKRIVHPASDCFGGIMFSRSHRPISGQLYPKASQGVETVKSEDENLNGVIFHRVENKWLLRVVKVSFLNYYKHFSLIFPKFETSFLKFRNIVK